MVIPAKGLGADFLRYSGTASEPSASEEEAKFFSSLALAFSPTFARTLPPPPPPPPPSEEGRRNAGGAAVDADAALGRAEEEEEEDGVKALEKKLAGKVVAEEEEGLVADGPGVLEADEGEGLGSSRVSLGSAGGRGCLLACADAARGAKRFDLSGGPLRKPDEEEEGTAEAEAGVPGSDPPSRGRRREREEGPERREPEALSRSSSAIWKRRNAQVISWKPFE